MCSLRPWPYRLFRIFALCLLITLWGSTGPTLPVASAPVAEATITITDQGFDPAQATITQGDTITFRNATGQAIGLIAGSTGLSLYLPMLHGGTNRITEPGTLALAHTGALPETFAVTIQPNQSYTHTFQAIGEQPVFRLGVSDAPALILVLRGGDIHGYLYTLAQTTPGDDPEQVFLPGIEVYARNTATGAVTPKVKTDLSGFYVIPFPGRGTYAICWDAPGWDAGCGPDPILTSEGTQYPLPIPIEAESALVAGKVTLADQTICRSLDTFFPTDAQTTVKLTNDAGDTVAGPVYANVYGDYVIPNAPTGNWKVTADCEAAHAELAITADPNIPAIVDLTLDNHVPVVEQVVATLAGQGVRLVQPGAEVQVSATVTDADGDLLHYRWADAYGNVTSEDAPTLTWNVPDAQGTHKLYVQVRDDHGGYALGTLTLRTGGILFSGDVRNDDGARLAGATVTLNGQTAVTNGQGHFAIVLAEESPRYVLTIEHATYALFSKVYYEGIPDGRITLHRAFQRTVDPTQLIELVEDDQPGAPATALSIAPNSLIDGSGNPPTGTLTLAMQTVDLADPANSFPGDDYAGLNASGQETGLVSYGAVDLRFTDAAGHAYNLAAGKSATLFLPVDAAQAATAPAAIALWSYDKLTGIWQQTGSATLTGSQYQAVVNRLGPLTVATEIADPTCARVLVDQRRLTLPVNVRVTVATGSGLNQIRTTTFADPLSVIQNLPPGAPVTLDLLDAAGNPIGNPISVATTAAGASAIDASGIDAIANSAIYPYPSCQAVMPIAPSTAHIPQKPPFPPPQGEFHFLIKEGIDDAASAAAYYAAIDPTNAKTTFADWKTANGLALDPDANQDGNLYNDDATTGELSAAYANDGDLGFGRGMHAKRVGNNTAFYVCNYVTVDDARLNLNQGACVAMEYSPVPPGTTRFTKFYVFNAAGNRIASANLDGRGEKYVPGLCMTCHGGSYNPAEIINANGNIPSHRRFRVSPAGDPNQGSFFLPFDLDAFGYSAVAGFRRADQEAKFKGLNNRVLDTASNNTIVQLIIGWYNNNSPTQITTFVPTAWSGSQSHANLYLQVIKPSCRTCHAAQDGKLNFELYADFDFYSGIARNRICTQRIMPNAIVTFNRFWLSQNPRQVTVLANAGLSDWATSDPCPTP